MIYHWRKQPAPNSYHAGSSSRDNLYSANAKVKEPCGEAMARDPIALAAVLPRLPSIRTRRSVRVHESIRYFVLDFALWRSFGAIAGHGSAVPTRSQDWRPAPHS